MTHTQTVLLYDNTLTEFNETCRSSVFGILADFAADTVTAYRSDLYHDAMWLSRMMVGIDFTLVFGVRPSGTFIAEATPDNESLAMTNRFKVMRLHVTITDSRCVAEVVAE